MLLRTSQSGIRITLLSFVLMIIFSSCLTSRKLDRFVAKQYNGEIPKEEKKNSPDINIITSFDVSSNAISTTETRTSNMLPLLFYWQWDYKNTCTLNPAIATNQFKNVISKQSKSLNQKLNGQQLEIKIEQAPNIFSFDDKAHLVWIIYAFGWDKISVQPDVKDLIVSYKILKDNQTVKEGKIVVPNTEKTKGLRYFQSWKSAVSEYIVQYNVDVVTMSRSFVSKLQEEL